MTKISSLLSWGNCKLRLKRSKMIANRYNERFRSDSSEICLISFIGFYSLNEINHTKNFNEGEWEFDDRKFLGKIIFFRFLRFSSSFYPDLPGQRGRCPCRHIRRSRSCGLPRETRSEFHRRSWELCVQSFRERPAYDRKPIQFSRTDQ